MKNTLNGVVLKGVVLIGSVVVAYTAMAVWQDRPRSFLDIDWSAVFRPTPDETPVNPFAAANGTNLIAYVLTSSECGWCTLPEATKAIGSFQTQIRTRYKSSYAQVSVVGVITDMEVNAGLDYIASLGNGDAGGPFDQVIVGGSWLNEQVVRFVWREQVARALTPQIIVIERPVNTDAYISASTIRVENDTLVANPTGYHEILAWLEADMPLEVESDSHDMGGSVPQPIIGARTVFVADKGCC